MAHLIRMPRAAWRRQPQTGFNVNVADFNSLVYLFTPEGGSFVDHLSRKTLTPTGALNNNPYDKGLFRSYNGVYMDRSMNLSIPTVSSVINNQYSFGILLATTYTTSDRYYFSEASTSTNYLGVRNGDGADKIQASFGGANNYIYTAPGFHDGNFKFVFLLRKNSNDKRLYVDNTMVGQNTTASPPPTGYQHIGVGGLNRNSSELITTSKIALLVGFQSFIDEATIKELVENPWQLFQPRPARFILIPSGGGGSSAFSIDALIQRAGLTHSTSIDALLQSAFSRSLSIDGLIAAVQTGVISLDALLQIVGTRTVSMDALLQAAKTGAVSVDALVQMTLAQSISLDALIVAASASAASVSLDALIQSLKTAGLSVDALLSKSMSAAAVMDALIQASKTGAVSLDAIITGASSASIFVGLDALIQAVQSRTLSVDALLQKAYTNALSLDAYLSLTRVQSVSVDALIQATKSGAVSVDALIQMTRMATVSFDALIQAAKAGAISLDAILVFATQASVLLDAYVQKTLSAGVGLDAIIGAIADMILPTGRVVSIPSSDRWVFVTHADRFIQVQ